ncbi:LysR family transcriptional regulator [Bordetella genomosp. 9]|uniref:LysR family transcriptional regulator n=1 Tax=Bordetella genomosp. 9 TaxID=1416803 RepID=UPI000A29468A|nr:LysR family transcriptional regulator [Bordetella genomosp. 9]ARP92457.1 LysR family transcriptional regulator [Bordetella genomosp. 9]
MNLRHLQFFVVLAETRNFTRAAQRLHVAQPALSQQIRALEDRLGAALIDRRTRPLRLTEAGTFFLAEARQILSQYERASSAARDIGEGRRGWLGIGFTRSAMYSVLPPALKQFSRTHPGVELKLYEMLAEEHAAALKEHRIHIGIGRQAEPIPGCATQVLLQEKLMAVLPADHPLAKRPRLRVQHLAELPFVFYPKHPNARFPRLVESLCRDAGFTPRVAHQAYEIQTAIALVAAGLGVTLVGESVARHGRADVVYLPLSGPSAAALTTLTATWRQEDDSPALADFLSVLLPAGRQ